MPVSVFAIGSDAVASGTASSSSDPTTPCDPQFMQALEARAWLEAQREVSQNENLIVKPDSVLEYSCFNQFLNKAASNWSGQDGINRQFSETDAWKTTGFTTTTTDTSLTNVVSSALSYYLAYNFPNTKYLGGRLDSPVKTMAADMYNTDGTAAYSCNVMAAVWEQARCQNFDQLTDKYKSVNSADSNFNQDGFRDFFYYANEVNDPRVLPEELSSCKKLDTNGDLATAYNKNLDEAFNKNQTMFVLKSPDDDQDPDTTQYTVDDVKTYFDLILPGTCSSNAIPTGVKIYRGSSSPTDDKICPNPGCSYDGSTCTSSGS